MPRNQFTGELHRPLHTQLPLELLSSCAEVGRRRLVFVYGWLWFYAGQADTAFPSVPRLALECGMKERDIRTALQTLQTEGWIVRKGTRPNGTKVYGVRMEAPRKKRTAKPLAVTSKSASPLPPGGRPPWGSTTPLQGESPLGSPLPPGGTPPEGDPNKKPINEEQTNPDKLITTQEINKRQPREKSSAAAPQVTTADAVVTDRQIVVTSDQNDAPQRHDPAELAACGSASRPAEPNSPQQAVRQLPDCAKPHRELLVEWAKRRRSRHPAAPRGLTPADIGAIEYANALGVLQPFLQQAAASGCKSLATGYRRRCEQLRAGPAASAAFEQLRGAYMASPRRVPSQSLPAAQQELVAVLAEGHTLEQLMAALAAEIRAQDQQHASTGFAPSLPDMARWLKARRFMAYLPGDQPAAIAVAAEFVAPIDPESGAPDPFAYHRHITGQ